MLFEKLFEKIVWDDRRRALRAACEWRRPVSDPRHPVAQVFSPAESFAGGHRIRVTPVPIPNTEVKPDTADGTAWETVWESRSLPAVIQTRTPDAQSSPRRAFLSVRLDHHRSRRFPRHPSARTASERSQVASSESSHCMGTAWQSKSLPADIAERPQEENEPQTREARAALSSGCPE